jgi:hypothetical protein
MFGDTHRVSPRSAHDQDAAASGFFEIDIVHAYPGAADDAKARGLVEKFSGNSGGAAHNEGVGVGDFFVESIFVGKNDVPAGATKEFDTAFADFVGNNNFQVGLVIQI